MIERRQQQRQQQQQRYTDSEDMETGLDEVAFAMDDLLRSDKDKVKRDKGDVTSKSELTTPGLDERENRQEPVTSNSSTFRTGTVCDLPPLKRDSFSRSSNNDCDFSNNNKPDPPGDESKKEEWACPQCTLLNSKVAPVCAACRQANPDMLKICGREDGGAASTASNESPTSQRQLLRGSVAAAVAAVNSANRSARDFTREAVNSAKGNAFAAVNSANRSARDLARECGDAVNSARGNAFAAVNSANRSARDLAKECGDAVNSAGDAVTDARIRLKQQADQINRRISSSVATTAKAVSEAPALIMSPQKDVDSTTIKVLGDDDAEIRRRAEALLSRIDQ